MVRICKCRGDSVNSTEAYLVSLPRARGSLLINAPYRRYDCYAIVKASHAPCTLVIPMLCALAP